MSLSIVLITIALCASSASGMIDGPGISTSAVSAFTQASTDSSTQRGSGPTVLDWIMPTYPEAAAEGHVEGTVVLRLSIGEDGSVRAVQVISGPTELAPAAASAAKQWKFEPTVSGGRAVPAESTVSFRFTFIGLRTEIPGVGIVEPPVLSHAVRPKYPAHARRRHIEGTVVLRGVIGKSGSVQKLELVSGPPDLREAATKAVRHWRYKPGRLKGQPVAVETTIRVVFRIGS